MDRTERSHPGKRKLKGHRFMNGKAFIKIAILLALIVLCVFLFFYLRPL